MQRVGSLVVVGPPEAGKDTLVAGVTGMEGVVVPERWSTRDLHPGEEPSDWVHKTPDEFAAALDAGELATHWTRAMNDIKSSLTSVVPEQYGHRRVADGDSRLPIYSANIPILEKPNALTWAVLAKAAIVLVTASQQRLHDRLAGIPEMSGKERQARDRKIDQNMPQIYRSGIIFSTEGLEPEDGQELFRNYVSTLLAGQVPWGYTIDGPRLEPAPNPLISQEQNTDGRLG